MKRWTRSGILDFNWMRSETFENLVLAPQLKERLEQRIGVFQKGQESFHSLHLPWRYGVFLYGTSGSGKTAASRGIAQKLGWQHLTLPAHEVLDSHLFERALAELVSESKRVLVLEDIDRMIRVMEPEVFFSLLDHAMERADGSFWVATSRHPEDVPKTQLLRPGRFDESIRLEAPQAELRKKLIQQVMPIEGLEWDEPTLLEWVDHTAGLTYSHFEELRQVAAKMKLEGQTLNDSWPILRSYVEDQMVAGDRLGGLSDTTTEMNERIRHLDPRVLMAALDMSDVFRRLMEKVIGDLAEAKARETQQDV